MNIALERTPCKHMPRRAPSVLSAKGPYAEAWIQGVVATPIRDPIGQVIGKSAASTSQDCPDFGRAQPSEWTPSAHW